MSVRTELADQLAKQCPEGWSVERTFRELKEIQEITVQVGAVTYRPDPLAPAAGREIELQLWLIAPFLDPDVAEDPLEDALEQLLAVVDGLPWIVWQSADRSSYPTGYPGFKITATSPSSRSEP